MSLGQVIIDEMTLNVPGLTPLEAKLMGQDVVKHLNQLLGEKAITQRSINHMALKVEIPQGTPREQLAGIIANQVCKSLI